MSDKLNVEKVLEQLDSENESERYKALVAIRDGRPEWTPDLLRALQKREDDASRPVRQLARDLIDHAVKALSGQLPSAEDLPVPLQPDEAPYPGSLLLALMSWGSCFTGAALIGLSMVNYFTLGKFPFPNPIEVLTVVFLVATLPFFIVGVLLLLPGRAQKQFALYFAYVSIIFFAVLTFALGPMFEVRWAVQFTRQDQALFQHFLSPYQLAMLFLPVFTGQGLLVYYLSTYLAQGDARQSRNRVDTADKAV